MAEVTKCVQEVLSWSGENLSDVLREVAKYCEGKSYSNPDMKLVRYENDYIVSLYGEYRFVTMNEVDAMREAKR